MLSDIKKLMFAQVVKENRRNKLTLLLSFLSETKEIKYKPGTYIFKSAVMCLGKIGSFSSDKGQ